MALHSIPTVAFCWRTQLTQSNLERESQKHKYPNLTLLLPASLLLVPFTGQTQANFRSYLLWVGLNKVRRDGSDAGCDVVEPADASDHNMKDVLPAVDVVIGSTKDIGNTL